VTRLDHGVEFANAVAARNIWRCGRDRGLRDFARQKMRVACFFLSGLAFELNDKRLITTH